MSETAWLGVLVAALALGGAVVLALLWRRVSRALYLGAEPPPRRAWDPAIVEVAEELRAQGLTPPAVPRAIAARAPASGVHARDSPSAVSAYPGGGPSKRYDVN